MKRESKLKDDLYKRGSTTLSKDGGTLSANSKSSAIDERRNRSDLRREESRVRVGGVCLQNVPYILSDTFFNPCFVFFLVNN